MLVPEPVDDPDPRESENGKKKALSILTAKLGRAVYFVLRRREVFEEERFFAAE